MADLSSNLPTPSLSASGQSSTMAAVEFTQLYSLTQILKVATLTENTTVEHYDGFTRIAA